MASLFGSIAYELGHGFAGKMGEIWKGNVPLLSLFAVLDYVLMLCWGY
jgi:hypothetical protein